MKRNVLTLTVLLTVTAGFTPAQVHIVMPVTTYKLTDLHPATIPEGWVSVATAIDNTGRVVGQSRNAAAASDAFETQPDAPFVVGGPDDLGRLSTDLSSEAYAISNKGMVVGDSVGNTTRAFLFVPGTGMEDLNTTGALGSQFLPNAVQMHAAGINDHGWIVGSYWTSSDNTGVFYQSHSFLSFGPGSTQPLDSNFGNPAHSGASDVNNNGQIVGYLTQTTNGEPIAYFFDMSTQHLLTIGNLPGMEMSVATALNDSGKVVGISQTINGITSHAFLFQDLNHNGVADAGELTDLDPTDNASGACAINSSGSVVGYVGDPSLINGESKATIFINGAATDLNTLVQGGTGTWTLRVASGVNDGGQIVGFMQNGRYGDVHAFRLDPVPVYRLP